MSDTVPMPDASVRGRWLCRIGIAALLSAHLALTLELFGPTSPWHQLLSEDPVTSGRHPLHFEQGDLAARSVLAGGSERTFDASCYAGYPQTPVFDIDARPAEWFQILSGGRFGPAAYKVGLVLTYWLVPAAFAVAAGLLRLGNGTALAAAGFGVLAAWCPPAAELIEKGHLCASLILILGALGLAAFARWHETPSGLSWIGLVAVTTAGWAVQPSLWICVLLLVLARWLLIGGRHGWRWHVALAFSQAIALAASWLSWGDWLRDWWVRLPVRPSGSENAWHELLALALWMSVVPAAAILTRTLSLMVARPYAGIAVTAGLICTAVGTANRWPPRWNEVDWGPKPLTIGFSADAVRLEETIRNATPQDARVLWEDLPARPDLAWTGLLPARVGRPFIGGLDPDGLLEHAGCALRAGLLAGRPLHTWSDMELDGYCRRYNVGCVVCASQPARERFARWTEAEPIDARDAATEWRVFVIRRPHSYVLKGHADQFEADARRVTLADVVPENGEVVLSLHYQEGWQVRPASVFVEREIDPYDPIPFVRLRMAGPVGRVTLTWDGR